MRTSGFDQYVGLAALENVSQRFCRCQEDFFGPICDKKLYQFKEMANCGRHGVFDSRNTVTGCSCRESVHGSATEYHGWYCERHNSELCGDDYVYIHGFNNTDIVGSDLNCKFNGTQTTIASTTTMSITTTTFPTTFIVPTTSVATTITTLTSTICITTTSATTSTTTSSTRSTSSTTEQTDQTTSFTTTDIEKETTTVLLTTVTGNITTSAINATTEIQTTKPPKNVTDHSLRSTDKILIGIFVPFGILFLVFVAFIIYNKCFKTRASVEPTATDVENQSKRNSATLEPSTQFGKDEHECDEKNESAASIISNIESNINLNSPALSFSE